MKNQIRIIEDQINKIEESVGNYPTEEKQIELNLLYTELNQLKQKHNEKSNHKPKGNTSLLY